jgi:Raf kinase inhibitor-like YbhB/YbcL family protein
MYTCDGANVSPPLSWTRAPAGTKSFALMLDDPNAPSGTFTHWITYDIPAGTAGLGEGQSGAKTGINDAGSQKYLGPCPPPSDGPHHYVFHLYALSADTVAFENEGPGRSLFLFQTAGLTLGRATLTGSFDH